MYPKHAFLHQLSDCFSLHPPSFGANGRCCHSLWHFSVAHWKLPLSFSTTTAFLVRKGIRRLLIGFDIFCPCAHQTSPPFIAQMLVIASLVPSIIVHFLHPPAGACCKASFRNIACIHRFCFRDVEILFSTYFVFFSALFS